jgi:hypothetical protein
MIKVWFDPRIRIVHRNRTKLKDFLRQQAWYGRGYYLVRKKNLDLYSAFPRNLNRWQDLVKLGWFIPGIFGEALAAGLRANSIGDKIAFIFLLILKEMWGRYGWIRAWADSELLIGNQSGFSR